ncbi:MAG TPA: XrtA system polysaccharide deacetylase [Gemmatimonadales bacterium]|nr:XrtA system polysaccharide deacetylase [Gemmatimonadales bacterium]
MRLTHVLSIDVEDWFQVEGYAEAIPRDQWPRCELRVADNVHRLLDLLDAAGARATFFVLGWLAERLPDVVREITRAGHEVASHGWTHTPVWALSEAAFFDEVSRSRALLQDLSGQPVIGYRAPTFSVIRPTRWALQTLRRAGYRYDSSIFPVHHDRYGIPDAPTVLHRADGIWEVPLSVLEFHKLRLPVAGGGYFRLYPLWLTRWAIRRLEQAGRPAVVYLHPWEFDPSQPWVRGVGALRSFRHRVGIARNARKLASLLRAFRFAPARTVLSELGVELEPAMPAAVPSHQGLGATRGDTLADRSVAYGTEVA